MGRGRYEPEQLRRVRGGTTAAEMLKDVLERQQAQLKQAEQQQEHAVHKSRDRQIAEGDDADDTEEPGALLSIEEQLKHHENTDGDWWDDSDDEQHLDNPTLSHSPSRATLTSGASSNDLKGEEENNGQVMDVWDL